MSIESNFKIRKIKEEAEKVYTALHDGMSKRRVTTKVLKYILLNHGDFSMVYGRGCRLKKRNLGAGVYEIWFERENND